ncbi:MAG TPA: single-stranded DNA-binding protein [Deltaproteobacteria bacterium]|nr:MAG: single-stranded DNA-binding protein [Deltaproteobacteria bacterium GWA2_65_63]OGP26544.1 MAG: single-stranded DNA-binding protein [Deltaproteobacteria bacterium GWB2_65_81]OGP36750.1 MAG: single-stranded DNA-binding protein [Deltaproteobacteria bacterium GWC2_66_88]OGP78295.1 MAG: single-stranded DNA-binding protein [Deltaproteobacteria bacterium RBG_16_66_15]HAM33185.1 single-stranded DNA-binding protein [Deltaproteobacteria bacterium]
MANISINRVILAGNLVRDPETRFLPSGVAVASFSIAVNRRYKSNNEVKEEVSFFDISVFGKAGENCAEYLSKGRSVLVEGRLRQRSWETDGVKRSKVEVVADNVQFLGSPRGASAEKGAPAAPAPESQDDDIPF